MSGAAVTGGTGFLGQTLVHLLVKQFPQVRVLYRRDEDETRIRQWGALPIRGDLCVEGGCDGLVAEGNVVYHSAARVDMTGVWADFQRTTVEGTRRLLQAVLPLRPARFVYVSSGAVYAWNERNGPISADRTPARPVFYNLYGRAKREAEKLVQRMCAEADCTWTIVRLGFLYGPRNQALLRQFVHVARREQMYIVGTGDNRIAACYLDDAAQAVLLAGTHPAAAGQIYDVASDERVTQREFLDATCDALDLPRPRHRVSSELLGHLAVSVMDCVGRMTGQSWPVTRSMVALMAADQVIDASKIRRELGWRPRTSFREGMERLRAWYRELEEQHVAPTRMSCQEMKPRINADERG